MIFLTGDAFNFLRTKEEEEELCVQDLKNTRVGVVRVGSECRAVVGCSNPTLTATDHLQLGTPHAEAGRLLKLTRSSEILQGWCILQQPYTPESYNF